jgi:uncharacterized membrane protein YraQ (UPF0718 family)
MCECGIIPIMRRLLRKGLPLSCCIAYVLGGPIINVVVLMSTAAAFSGMGALPMTILRGGLGYVVAVLTAFVVQWQYRKYGDSLLTPLTRPGLPAPDEEVSAASRPLGERVSNITATALHDFVDITVFLILGAGLAATVRMFLTPDQIGDYGREYALLAIVLMMGLAVALCLCSEADAFVAASFVKLPAAAKLSFLVLGPMLDFKLYAMYTRIFRPRLIATVYVCVISQVFVYSAIAHYVLPEKWFEPEKRVKALSEEQVRNQAVRAGLGVGMLGMPMPGGGNPATLAAACGLMAGRTDRQVPEVSFLGLEEAARQPELRAYYQGRLVLMKGRFSGSARQFTLLRYKINCCAADATPLRALLYVDTASDQKLDVASLNNKWVEVIGRVQFIPSPGGYLPALVITPTPQMPLKDLVKETETGGDVYLY